MSKYSKEQLSEFASDVIYFYNMQDQRADILIMHLSSIFQVHPEHVIQRIRGLIINEH